MSSHCEAPSVSSLLAFVGLPILATLQVGSDFAFDVLEPLEVPSAEEWHVNLNITDFYAFLKPGDAHKTVLIMNVNPMPPKLSACRSNNIYVLSVADGQKTPFSS